MNLKYSQKLDLITNSMKVFTEKLINCEWIKSIHSFIVKLVITIQYQKKNLRNYSNMGKA